MVLLWKSVDVNVETTRMFCSSVLKQTVVSPQKYFLQIHHFVILYIIFVKNLVAFLLVSLFPKLFGSDRNTSATNSLSAFVWFSMTDFVLISNCSLSTMYWKSFPKKSCVKIWVKGNVRRFWYGMETLLFGRAAVWLSLTVSVICGFLGSVSITFQNSSNQTWYFNASFRKHWRQLAVIWKRNWCSVWKLKSDFFFLLNSFFHEPENCSQRM